MFILVILLIFGFCGEVWAQSQPNPPYQYGITRTAGQINNDFAAKQNWLGSNPLLISGGALTGLLDLYPSSSTSSGFNVGIGTAPAAPNNGDIWETSSGLYARIGGTTYQLLPVATPLDIPGSSTSGAQFNIGIGSAPTSPNNGDLWETSVGLFARIAGLTYQLSPIIGPIALTPSSATRAQFNLGIGSAPTSPNNGDVWETTSGIFTQDNGVTQQFTTSVSAVTSANLFRNPRMDVWQRGTSITASTANTCASTTLAACTQADGWGVIVTGANLVAAQTTGNSANMGSNAALQISGASGNTGTALEQRIEAALSAQMAQGNSVTVQFEFYNNSGASITPTLLGYYPGSANTFSSGVTADTTGFSGGSAQNMQACVAATYCKEAYSFTPSANAANGYEIAIGLGALTSGTVAITSVSLQVTPNVIAAGANSNPPSNPDLRNIGQEITICQRYLDVLSANGVANAILGSSVNSATTTAITALFYPVQRAVPVISFSAASTLQIVVPGNASYTTSANSSSAISLGSVNISSTISGATALQPGFLRDAGAGTAAITISSEL